MKKHYDIVIVGGGLVGATLAIALKKSNYSVAVLESNHPESFSQSSESSLNQRAIVLSKASQNILSALGLWQNLSSYITPITNIHVSNKGHIGAVRLSAQDQNVDALGYVVIAKYLYQELQAALKEITVFYGAKFTHLDRVDGKAEVYFEKDGNQKITADLVVATDGGQSTVREQQKITTTSHDYQQKVIICNVQLQHSHQHYAYERFTSVGPCALLPLLEKTCAVVWATKPDEADRLVALEKETFLEQLQINFGYRLGKFTDCNKPFAVPLNLIRAQELVKENLVLIGNAAQSLHPIAGQGLNLGLRDMAALVEVLHYTKKNIGDISLLREYAEWRRVDHNQTVGFTHGLVTLFSTDFLPINIGTSAGMMMLERSSTMRNLFAKAAMGFVGKLPKLVCGIAL